MSEEHNTDTTVEEENSESVNRRKFVKSLSVASGTAAFGALGSTPVSAKDDGNTEDIEKDTGDSASKAIEKSQSSQRYKILKKHLRSEKDLVLDGARIEVYVRNDVDDSGVRRISSFPMSSTTGEYFRSGIAATLRQGKVQTVTASVTKEISDGTLRVTHYEVVDGEVQEDVVSVDTDTMTVEQEGSTIGSSAHARDLATTQSSVQCDACFAFGDLVCSIGCGAPTGVICAALTAGTLGAGVACGAFTTTFCAALAFVNEQYTGSACRQDRLMEKVCSRANAC